MTNLAITQSGRQAIQTRYIGPSNTKGSRISAKCDGGRIVTSSDLSLGQEDRHVAAARMLAEKMGWSGTLVGGALPAPHRGYAFVFVD